MWKLLVAVQLLASQKSLYRMLVISSDFMRSTFSACGGYKEGSRKLQGKYPDRRSLSHDIQTMGTGG